MKISMLIYNDLHGFIGRRDLVFRTLDGGLNWEETSLVTSDLDGMHFFDSTNGFLIHHVHENEVYQGMKIYETIDGGLSWIESELIDDCKISRRLQAIDDNNILSFGRGVNHRIKRN